MPSHPRWQRRDMFGFDEPYSLAYQLHLKDRPAGIFVTSEYDQVGPLWHIAVSALWRRPSEDEVRIVLEDFGAEAFEELATKRSLLRHFYWPSV